MSKHSGGNIKLAVIADEVYKKPSERGERNGWRYVSGDKRHGIWNKGSQAVIGVRGTDFKDPKDVADDVAIGVGALKLTPRYKQAKKWVKKAIKKYGKNNVQVSGHSLGGKIAKELAKDFAIKFAIKGSTFNAGASVSDAVSSIGDRVACKINKKGKRCKKAKKVENYRTKIDPVSAAAVGDINTNTVKRKKGLDPHAIANFVPEEQPSARETQEGGGVGNQADFKEAMTQAGQRALDRFRTLNAAILVDQPAINEVLMTAEPPVIQSEFLRVYHENKDTTEYPISQTRMNDFIRQGYNNLEEAYGAYFNIPTMEQEEEKKEEQEGEGCCGSRTTMCGMGRKRYEFTQVGGRRTRRGKSMVQAPPPPPPVVKPKRKPMSQKEYCSLYRCY
jgi:hypothetical protein